MLYSIRDIHISMVEVICTQCSKPVKRRQYHVALTQRPFCGFPCYAEWQKVNRVGIGRKRVKVSCYTCGKIFAKQPSAVSEHNFCGRDCFAKWRASEAWAGKNNPSWLGGHVNYRGTDWNKQSAAARKRDDDACQRCGKQAPGLPVHHLIPFHLFDNYREANQLTNLITLCPTCHGIAEIKFWREHPELIQGRCFPDCAPIATCSKCGNEFLPRSGRTEVCDACCTSTCAYCSSVFYTRKATFRHVKYCSRKCRNLDIQVRGKTCEGCGTLFYVRKPKQQFCSVQCRMTHKHPRRKSSPIT